MLHAADGNQSLSVDVQCVHDARLAGFRDGEAGSHHRGRRWPTGEARKAYNDGWRDGGEQARDRAKLEFWDRNYGNPSLD